MVSPVLGLAAQSTLALWLACCSAALAQRDLKDIPDPDPEIERRSFQVADGFEVNLYAADPMLAKPIQINFDADGRLWVASSETYPHVKPGQTADDKILVLEDSNADGRAGKTTIFARGLLIPTGVEPGDGGAYVANSTELLHLKDTDGDGAADERRVVLSGFGTEDTHHIVHTFRWGFDGNLYFNQSIYIHSHVETPYGVRRLASGGVWQFRPDSMKLEVFARGLINSWGHHWDRWGNSFQSDGAGYEGINYVFPGATMTTYAGAERILAGLNPGSPKYCALEVVSGRHMPDDWQGSLVTCDFRAHRVCRFALAENGAGFTSREQPEVIRSTHAAFRPIDVKMGPDGALYVADWYNPIIQHGEVDFRDPRRDHVHGRIWRVTAKGRPLVERPKLSGASTAALLDLLKSPEDWTRHHARLQLKQRGAGVLPELAGWVARLDGADPEHVHHQLEALWIYQALDSVEPKLLRTLLRASDYRARAAATRVLGAWHDRVPGALALLKAQSSDEHPRVRLEAVRALAQLQSAQAAEAAMLAVDHPVDRFLDHALFLTARELEPYWLPALEAGTIDFDGNVGRLTHVLLTTSTPGVARPLAKLLASGKIPPQRLHAVYLLLAQVGGASELGVVFERVLGDVAPPAEREELLLALVKSAEHRNVRPPGDLAKLSRLLGQGDPALRVAVARATGAWRVESLEGVLAALGSGAETSPALRRAAIDALASQGKPSSRARLNELASAKQPHAVRLMAVAALTRLDLAAAAIHAVDLLATAPVDADMPALLSAFTERKDGAAALIAALGNRTLPADAAKRATRALRNLAGENAELIAALSTAGKIGAVSQAWTAADVPKLAAEVLAKGDARSGEAVFRRREQSCLKCHSIAGAGGRVGPDLASVGASAPVDYLVESILMPGAKVKESQLSLVVATDDGRIVSGIRVQQNGTELILRDAEDRQHSIPVAAIESQKAGGSLMPTGLADGLPRQELLDLVRFLSELGKVGPYAVSNARVARRWQMLADPTAAGAIASGGLDVAAWAPRPWNWEAAYSTVSGELPLVGVPPIQHAGSFVGIVRFELEVAAAGPLKLVVPGKLVKRMWIDAEPAGVQDEITVALRAGLHAVTLAVDRTDLAQSLRVELAEVPASPAQAQFVGGK